MKNNLSSLLIFLLIIFFISLSYAGVLAYKSIDFQILQKLESTPLNLPTLIPTVIPQTPPPHSSTN